ncbi:hypothetical protein GPA27_06305 [Aromatoleum toluolicum]|uniref:Alanine racemase n=1 Tax=Aromatoleum toluolicum TaxID=90060 RepID=A0ABX1NCK1_9RHOO|nr:hypothetical protein [Aromatoleum toluolicum]NMF96996.1 hypothetical protein [Aromatoleum toluolicum]
MTPSTGASTAANGEFDRLTEFCAEAPGMRFLERLRGRVRCSADSVAAGPDLAMDDVAGRAGTIGYEILTSLGNCPVFGDTSSIA